MKCRVLMWAVILFGCMGGDLLAAGAMADAAANDNALPDLSALDRRINSEFSNADNVFAILPHKPNYLMPVSWNTRPNTDPYSDLEPELSYELDPVEVNFQLSFKVLLVKDLFHNKGVLAFAYTNQSWWQAYNSDISSPFRETNHEPELMLGYPLGLTMGDFSLSHAVLGLNHQSNGKSGLQSRSWNRIYLSLLISYKHLYVQIRPWYRIPEARKDSPTDPAGDDNPDIDAYLGNGDLLFIFKPRVDHTVSLQVRNNLRSGHENRGAVQLTWSFPLHHRLKGYVMYFNGYGESLIDYNDSVNRLGIGVSLTDWL
ncbi:MAG: phospholipase [Deltaproteobacteria bacterium]|nr:MAG: phospholipase [Deltaproteobacteria bacterium]